MRTPFDSVVEVDDLLEETGAYALRYGRPGSTATLAAGAGLRQRIKTSESLVLVWKPSRSAAHPVPGGAGDPRVGGRGASAGLVPRAGVPGLTHRPRLPITSG